MKSRIRSEHRNWRGENDQPLFGLVYQICGAVHVKCFISSITVFQQNVPFCWSWSFVHVQHLICLTSIPGCQYIYNLYVGNRCMLPLRHVKPPYLLELLLMQLHWTHNTVLYTGSNLCPQLASVTVG